jgi:tRNA A37 threonylcarbamoyltransferase TsaD
VNCVTVGGGVSVNTRLREKITAFGQAGGIRVVFAEPQYCLDNAAMVAGLAGAGQGIGGQQAWGVDVSPNLAIGVEYSA